MKISIPFRVFRRQPPLSLPCQAMQAVNPVEIRWLVATKYPAWNRSNMRLKDMSNGLRHTNQMSS